MRAVCGARHVLLELNFFARRDDLDVRQVVNLRRIGNPPRAPNQIPGPIWLRLRCSVLLQLQIFPAREDSDVRQAGSLRPVVNRLGAVNRETIWLRLCSDVLPQLQIFPAREDSNVRQAGSLRPVVNRPGAVNRETIWLRLRCGVGQDGILRRIGNPPGPPHRNPDQAKFPVRQVVNLRAIVNRGSD